MSSILIVTVGTGSGLQDANTRLQEELDAVRKRALDGRDARRPVAQAAQTPPHLSPANGRSEQFGIGS